MSLGPLMACSLHLDDIRDEKRVPSPGADQRSKSAPNEEQGTNLKDQIKLFQLYVSACELNGPQLEDADSSDESIHHGRDSCASSKGPRGSKSGSTFDSFLLKAGGRTSIRGASYSLASASLPSPPPEEDRRQSSVPNHKRRSLSSCSFSDSPTLSFSRSPAKPTTLGSLNPGCSQLDSALRPASENCAEFDVYKSQVITALTKGKAVWL